MNWNGSVEHLSHYDNVLNMLMKILGCLYLSERREAWLSMKWWLKFNRSVNEVSIDNFLYIWLCTVHTFEKKIKRAFYYYGAYHGANVNENNIMENPLWTLSSFISHTQLWWCMSYYYCKLQLDWAQPALWLCRKKVFKKFLIKSCSRKLANGILRM